MNEQVSLTLFSFRFSIQRTSLLVRSESKEASQESLIYLMACLLIPKTTLSLLICGITGYLYSPPPVNSSTTLPATPGSPCACPPTFQSLKVRISTTFDLPLLISRQIAFEFIPISVREGMKLIFSSIQLSISCVTHRLKGVPVV